MISATMPNAGRMRTYTSGCARNQKRCCQSSGFPCPAFCMTWPLTTRPDGMKNDDPATRSMSCSTPAASRGGKASSSRNDVTNCAHTKKGKRMNVSPGARSWMVVTMQWIERSSDEVIRKIIPTSHQVCPEPWMFDSGGYDVQPDCAAPPSGMKNERSMVTPPRKYDQYDIMLIFG